MLGWYAKHDGRAVQAFHPMYTYSQIHTDNSYGGGGSSAAGGSVGAGGIGSEAWSARGGESTVT